MRNVQRTFTSIVEQVPYLPEELQVAVANVDDPGALAHLIAGALRLKTEEKQALLEERDVARRLRRALGDPRPRARGHLARLQDPVRRSSPSSTRSQREYFLRQQLKAIQDELGEVDEMAAEANELREQLDARRAARGGAHARSTASSARLERLPAAGCRARRDPQLPGVDRLAAVGQGDRGQPRPQARARRCSTRTTTTSSRSRTASSSSWRCASSSPTPAARSCASSARPASARPRSGARSPARWDATSSASQRRRRARRGRDPRPPPHLHRRDARRRSSARCATPAPTTRCS